MNSILNKHAFSGPSIEMGKSGGSFAAESIFNGHIAFFAWSRKEVGRLLPPDLELAVNRSATPDAHPLGLVFGDQTEGAWIVGGRRVPLGFLYQELGLVVPFVKHRRGRYLHTHILRIYANYFPVVWNGNTNYGLGKRMAIVAAQGPFFVVSDENGVLLLHAAVEPRGEWVAGPACDLPNFVALREIFSLPIVARTKRGAYVCSYFGWDFDFAEVRPADCGVSIDAPLVDGMSPRWCHDLTAGSFEVRGMVWRLSWPLPCRF
jgi:hypothetical protein